MQVTQMYIKGTKTQGTSSNCSGSTETQAIDEMIIEGQKGTRSNGQKQHRNITNFRNGNGSTEPHANAELIVEAQKHMQQQKLKNAFISKTVFEWSRQR